MRQHHSVQFKAQVVRAGLREEKALAQLASEYGVHPTPISTWNMTALQELPQVFAVLRHTFHGNGRDDSGKGGESAFCVFPTPSVS